MYFLIDSENVQNKGMNGIEDLTENDTVEIFYTVHFTSVHIEMAQKLMKSKAKILFTNVSCEHDNALDFQLITKLFCLIDPDIPYVIISKDKGYDCAITMAASLGYTNVRRAECIQMAVRPDEPSIMPVKKNPPLPEAQKKDPVLSLISHMHDKSHVDLSRESAEFVLDSARKSATKAVFYNQFVMAYGQKDGSSFYKKIKDEFNWIKQLIK